MFAILILNGSLQHIRNITMEELPETINWQIRKYKKKLRQIERLVCSPRALNQEEQSKVSQKTALQESLLLYMKLLERHQALHGDSYQSGDDKLLNEASAPEVVMATAPQADVGIDLQQPPPAKRVAVDSPREINESSSNKSDLQRLECVAIQSDLPDEKSQKSSSQPEQPTRESPIFSNQSEQTTEKPQESTSQSGQSVEKPHKSTSQSGQPVEKPHKSTSQSRQPVEKPQKSTSQSEKLAPKARRLMSYSVSELSNGHSDIIFSTDSCNNLAVTAGRDASIQVYKFRPVNNELSCHAECRLTGHTLAVNAARLVDCSDCPVLLEALGLAVTTGKDSAILCVTGSEDATLRIWYCASGRQLFEHYVFASVTALQALKSNGTLLLLTGSSSGKLELWDPAGLWDRGACLLADQLFNGRVADLQVYNGGVSGAMATGRGKLLAACSSVGELALCQLEDPSAAESGSLRVARRPLLCFLTSTTAAAAEMSAASTRLRLRQPSAIRLLPSAASACRGAVLAVADRRCSGVKCVGVRLAGCGTESPEDSTVVSVQRPSATARSATSICDCLLLLPNHREDGQLRPLMIVAAFDYLNGSSFLQVFDAESLVSRGKTDSNSSGGIGRILSLSAVEDEGDGSNDVAFTLISGGDRALFWRFYYAASNKSSGRLAIIADATRRGPSVAAAAAAAAASTSALSSSDLDDNESGDGDGEMGDDGDVDKGSAAVNQRRSWCSVA